MMTNRVALACLLALAGCESSTTTNASSPDGGSSVATPVETNALTYGDCHATPASANVASSPLRLGVDELVARHFYVVYSGASISRNGSERLDSLANIYVLRGTTSRGRTQVWIFGTGYGDRSTEEQYRDPNKLPTQNAVDDVAEVDHVIRDCMGLASSNVQIRFVAPHVHLDHVNQEFFSELFDGFNYSQASARLFVHTNSLDRITQCESVPDYCCGDLPCGPTSPYWGSPFDPQWSAETVAKFETLGAANNVCGEVIGSFRSAIGAWTIRRGNSHTSGTIDLVNEDRGLWISGSKLPDDVNDCPPDPGFLNLHVHDLVVLE